MAKKFISVVETKKDVENEKYPIRYEGETMNTVVRRPQYLI